MRMRTEEHIQARGHLSTNAAARIYQKPGRIQQLTRLKARGLTRANQVQKDFVASCRSGSFPKVRKAVD